MLIDLPNEHLIEAKQYIESFAPNIIPESSTWCIAGGFLRGIVSGLPWSDIDIFIKSDKECHRYHYQGTFPLIDVVEVSSHTPLERVKTFDFVCCVAAIGRGKSGVWWGKCHEKFVEHCEKKKLVLNENWGGRTSWARITKLQQQGWMIEDEDLGKIARKLMLDKKRMGVSELSNVETPENPPSESENEWPWPPPPMREI